jgi:hypothetical protein
VPSEENTDRYPGKITSSSVSISRGPTAEGTYKASLSSGLNVLPDILSPSGVDV